MRARSGRNRRRSKYIITHALFFLHFRDIRHSGRQFVIGKHHFAAWTSSRPGEYLDHRVEEHCSKLFWCGYKNERDLLAWGYNQRTEIKNKCEKKKKGAYMQQ